MKKTMILAAAVLGLTFGAEAQKPESSQFSIESQFGIDGTPISSPTIRGRYFLDAKMPIRAEVGFATSNESTPVTEPFTQNVGRFDMQTVTYGIGAGIEMHWDGTDRLSPYYGGQLNFTRVISNQNWYNAEGPTWGPTLKMGNTKTITSATNWWGIDIVAGADYYFAQNVYLGVEIGYNLSLMVAGEQAEWENDQRLDVTEQPTDYFVSPGAVSGLRLGWRF